MLCGNGPEQTQMLARVLGMTKASSIDNNYERIMKDYLHKKIVTIADQITFDNLLLEAKEQCKIQFPEKYESLWPLYHEYLTGRASDSKAQPHDEIKNKPLKLKASIDMGWQKRGSARSYNSPSGHMFLIGVNKGLVMRYHICTKFCNTCEVAKRMNKDVRKHDCVQNYKGSSKGMECHAALLLVESVYDFSDGLVYMDVLVADDDSTMRSYVSYTGCLREPIPEPDWLTDPNHRIKCMCNGVYKQVTKNRLISNADAKRFQFYLGWFIKTNRKRKDMTCANFAEKMKCVVEHMFGNHEYCTSDFCWRAHEEYMNKIYLSLGLEFDDQKNEYTVPINKGGQSSQSEKDDELGNTLIDTETCCKDDIELSQITIDSRSEYDKIPDSQSQVSIPVNKVECKYMSLQITSSMISIHSNNLLFFNIVKYSTTFISNRTFF